ncbi:metal-dependent hydrolase [Salinibaculum rarum]|uniref:metal-dependent hydrolase n=1 Tax=Salinibaculum rarum TaxID=3058903 RepID=UPI0034E95430
MYWKGHYGITLLLATPISAALIVTGHPSIAYLVTGLMLSTSVLPDVDRKLPLVTHRGPTHTVWFGAGIGVLGAGFFGNSLPPSTLPFGLSHTMFVTIIFLGMTAGILSHLLGDIITHSGIQPFAPLSTTTYTLHLTTAANSTLNAVLFTSGLLIWALTMGLN